MRATYSQGPHPDSALWAKQHFLFTGRRRALITNHLALQQRWEHCCCPTTGCTLKWSTISWGNVLPCVQYGQLCPGLVSLQQARHHTLRPLRQLFYSLTARSSFWMTHNVRLRQRQGKRVKYYTRMYNNKVTYRHISYLNRHNTWRYVHIATCHYPAVVTTSMHWNARLLHFNLHTCIFATARFSVVTLQWLGNLYTDKQSRLLTPGQRIQISSCGSSRYNRPFSRKAFQRVKAEKPQVLPNVAADGPVQLSSVQAMSLNERAQNQSCWTSSPKWNAAIINVIMLPTLTGKNVRHTHARLPTRVLWKDWQRWYVSVLASKNLELISLT